MSVTSARLVVPLRVVPAVVSRGVSLRSCCSFRATQIVVGGAWNCPTVLWRATPPGRTAIGRTETKQRSQFSRDLPTSRFLYWGMSGGATAAAAAAGVAQSGVVQWSVGPESVLRKQPAAHVARDERLADGLCAVGTARVQRGASP
eukprot:COSAG01_NODE_839_length_13190_cov_138.958368_2_plen_146_part_00